MALAVARPTQPIAGAPCHTLVEPQCAGPAGPCHAQTRIGIFGWHRTAANLATTAHQNRHDPRAKWPEVDVNAP